MRDVKALPLSKIYLIITKILIQSVRNNFQTIVMSFNRTCQRSVPSPKPDHGYVTNPDWIDDNPYAFHMFENDNANQILFTKEIDLIQRLRSLQKYLTKYKKRLKASLLSFQGTKSGLVRVRL